MGWGKTGTGGPAAGSALGVELDLLAHHVLGEAGAQVVLETVGEGHDHVLDAAVLDQLGEQGPSFTAVIVAEEVLDHVDGELPREVEHRVVEEKGDELF